MGSSTMWIRVLRLVLASIGAAIAVGGLWLYKPREIPLNAFIVGVMIFSTGPFAIYVLAVRTTRWSVIGGIALILVTVTYVLKTFADEHSTAALGFGTYPFFNYGIVVVTAIWDSSYREKIESVLPPKERSK